MLFQVNPHTHQVKLCDFGSAKVLVFSSSSVLFLTVEHLLAIEQYITHGWMHKTRLSSTTLNALLHLCSCSCSCRWRQVVLTHFQFHAWYVWVCLPCFVWTFSSLSMTGQRRAKYIIYLFSLLSSTWAYIWGNWIHYCHWHMVCGLCSCWTASWTGFLYGIKSSTYSFIFSRKWIHILLFFLSVLATLL